MHKSTLTVILLALLSACSQPQESRHTSDSADTPDNSIRTLTPALDDASSLGYAQLPSFQSQLPDSTQTQPLSIPMNEKQRISKILLAGIDEAAIINSDIIEPSADNQQLAEGFVNFQQARLDYTLPDPTDESNASFIQYTLNGKHDISAFDKDMMKKIIVIGGEKDADGFLAALFDAPKNSSHGCTYQEKALKYGIIEFASCDENQKTLFTLYQPS